MTLSKKSINNFANQYNVAVSTKSQAFSVEATSVNLEILGLFKEAGLIKNFFFEPFDPVHSTTTKEELKPFVSLEHKWVDNKINFFNFSEFGAILANKVPYVRDTITPTTYRIWQEKYEYVEDFAKIGTINSLLNVDLKDYTFKLFLIEVLGVLENLKKTKGACSGDLCYFMNPSEHVKVTAGKMNSLMVNDRWFSVDKTWDAFLKTVKKLYSGYLRGSFGKTPYYVIFDDFYIKALNDYIAYIDQYTPLLAEHFTSRVKIPLLIPDDNSNLKKIFYDNARIIVYPKYDKSVPGIRKMLTCGGTQVWRYVSYSYLRQLCNVDGFNTFYLISTSNGLTLTTLDWVLSNQGGLLILKINV